MEAMACSVPVGLAQNREAIDALRVDPIHLAHALGEIVLGRFNHDMIMVGHQTGGITQPAHALIYYRRHVAERQAVAIIKENIGTAVATRGDMVEHTWKFESEGMGHDA
jgi:hypothetical protein